MDLLVSNQIFFLEIWVKDWQILEFGESQNLVNLRIWWISEFGESYLILLKKRERERMRKLRIVCAALPIILSIDLSIQKPIELSANTLLWNKSQKVIIEYHLLLQFEADIHSKYTFTLETLADVLQNPILFLIPIH